MRRHLLFQDILKHGKAMNTNMTTLIFLLASMNDRAITKFHKEFMEKPILKK